MEISEKIKALREQKAWSQEHLSSITGLSPKTIQRIEAGKNTPSFESQQALAQAFDIEIRDLRDTLSLKNDDDLPREYILEVYFEGECIEQQSYFSPIIPPLPGEQFYILFKNSNYSNEYGNWWLVKKRKHLKFNESVNTETLMLECVPDPQKGL
jgi:transcriptional regulator with XRE-family HTH domain